MQDGRMQIEKLNASFQFRGAEYQLEVGRSTPFGATFAEFPGLSAQTGAFPQAAS
jgi:hypothetical protein